MYLHRKFKNSEFDIISAFTRTYWTLGAQIHWNLVTKKDIPELDSNIFCVDIHILCFQFSFDYYWYSKSSLSSK